MANIPRILGIVAGVALFFSIIFFAIGNKEVRAIIMEGGITNETQCVDCVSAGTGVYIVSYAAMDGWPDVVPGAQFPVEDPAPVLADDFDERDYTGIYARIFVTWNQTISTTGFEKYAMPVTKKGNPDNKGFYTEDQKDNLLSAATGAAVAEGTTFCNYVTSMDIGLNLFVGSYATQNGSYFDVCTSAKDKNESDPRTDFFFETYRDAIYAEEGLVNETNENDVPYYHILTTPNSRIDTDPISFPSGLAGTYLVVQYYYVLSLKDSGLSTLVGMVGPFVALGAVFLTICLLCLIGALVVFLVKGTGSTTVVEDE